MSVGHFTLALDFVEALLALGDALQSGDQGVAIGEPLAPARRLGTQGAMTFAVHGDR